MKKTVKIVATLLLAVMLCMMGTQVFALTDTSESVEQGGLIDPGKLTGTQTAGTDITGVGNKIIGIIQAVGSVIAVIVLLILGIKYMMGSAEEKAEYKKTMLPYLIGAVILLLASNIVGAIFNTVGGIFGTAA